MASYRYQSLAALPQSGGGAYLGLAIIDDARAEPVVLVWVPEALASDIEKSEQVQRETERAALLEHPHIIRVYGFARLEQGLARVVEFADGENLRRVLREAGPLPPKLAARLMADAAQGVHYAHLAGNDDGTPLLHGDLRPETLLVSYGGLCKVSGYGASAFARDATVRFRRVAPEQLLGGRGAMNVTTDVYLLGTTLFECLTGKAPFEDAPDFEAAVLTQDLDPSAYPEIPGALWPVLQRALAKKAKDRFPSALLMREALELAWPDLPTTGDVSAWLNERFPDQTGARADRQKLIDAGIAGFARAQWEKSAAQPTTQPPFPAVQPPPVAAPPPSPPPAPTAPIAAPAAPVSTPAPVVQPRAAPPAAPTRARAASQDSQDPQDAPLAASPRSRAPLVIGVVGLLLGLLALGLALTRSSSSSSPAPTDDLSAELTPLVPEPQAAPLADAGADATAARAEADAGAQAAAPDAADAGAGAAEAAIAQGTLALTVDPPVRVEVDGRPVGKSPLRVALEPGRRRLRLVDRDRGIDVVRSVTVAAGGTTTESIYLQRGFVSVTAPPGATISIDGKTVGTAPLAQDVSLYEGSHVLEVQAGKAKFREAFTVKPNQRVYFDVGPQYQ